MKMLAFHDGGPGPWILFVPLVWAAALAAVFSVVRRVRGGRLGPAARGLRPAAAGRSGHDEHSPIAVIGRRFASGEIDEEEYWRRMSVLEE
ncbi:SHOCT domain-containing protein, partial [Streptomyces fuscigenes]|uniref:SHOCT domain-containing protein n=1 Tax=Streptomyces fuscigenes TaxID=1528880 RepID=UPI001F18DCA6